MVNDPGANLAQSFSSNISLYYILWPLVQRIQLQNFSDPSFWLLKNESNDWSTQNPRTYRKLLLEIYEKCIDDIENPSAVHTRHSKKV